MVFGNGISFSGLASGLDTQSIISQLVSLERLPIEQLENRKDEEQAKIDRVGNFKNLVKELQEAADGLRTSEGFFAFSGTVSVEGFVDVTVGSNAAAGVHSVEVVQTARTDRFAFDGVVDVDAALATAAGQQVSFDINGQSYAVTIDQANSSLNGIASAINSAAGDDVTASVVNSGTELNPSYQLVLASDQSGADHVITNLSSSVANLNVDGTAGGVNNITVGTNATAIIDGLTIERANNDFSDVIQGVTLDLVSASSGQEITIAVDADREAIKANVQELVDKYNSVMDFINEQSEFTEEDGTGGELFGDSILSSVRSSLSSAIFNVDQTVVANDTEGYSTLSLIGIKQDNDGRLSIDSTIFDAKATDNLSLLADLFVDSDGFERDPAAVVNSPEYFVDISADSGIAEALHRSIERMLRTTEGPIINQTTGERLTLKGIFDSREEALMNKIERFDDQIEVRERRLEQFEQNLIARYTALEETMGLLNAQGASLSAALANLPGFNS